MNCIVLADDDPLARRTQTELLTKWGFDVAAFAEGNEAWITLERQTSPCIALLNFRLPQLDGLEICRRLRERAVNVKQHLILMGNAATREDVLRAVETVADDFVIKPCQPQELRIRLRLGRRLLESRESVDTQAARDLLTGALNRDAIMRELGNELDRGRRQQTPVSILLASIDNFDRVQRTYGPVAANSMLKEAVARLSDGLRPYDSVGCYGEGQYLLVMPGCDVAPAEKQALRLVKQVSGKPFEVAKAPVFGTCTIGVAGTPGGTDVPAAELVGRANNALVAARTLGGNRVQLAGT
ncbi:MAG: GGDEF domain-containing protein [Candidatus Sumerlaeaceae bacterium]